MSALSTDLVVAEPGLTELASLANREYRNARQAAETAVRHALACGEALLAAQKLIPHGGWQEWLALNHEGSEASAARYMRIAAYRDVIETEGATSIENALGLLEDSPRRGRYRPLEEKALALFAEGARQTDIAQQLGVGASTVCHWVNPDVKHQQRVREREARGHAARHRRDVRQQRREAAIRKRGGSVAEAYSTIRRAAQAVGRAEEDASSRDVRSALREALSQVHHAEDAIVRALGIA
jgi:transposase